ncbi:DNA primase-helicase subunit [Aeromonas phage AS-yj]|uniref:DnaB-like replicative helicase n=2 Tax=Ceceduovirus TaxID=2842588 RepID=A0A291LF89_9CAUD|nr:DNA primase-helicase subunit [Aeromonas phage AS-sw]ATI18020.1 DNA primase-helicase subunit [Aeromonas phage AS-yj]ATI18325.1 DNA primase-helicase subunit [Aeromonas phage AS-sw]
MSISQIIINNLVFNGEYFGKVYPFLKSEYFSKGPYRIAFDLIDTYAKKHNKAPSVAALDVMLERKQNMSQVEYDQTKVLVSRIEQIPEDKNWLIEETESFCKERAIDIALSECIQIRENFAKPLDEQDPKIKDIGAMQEIMKKAMSVGFTFDVGHDYMNSAEERWEAYNQKTNKIPFLNHMLNRITKGGVERGTLNVILAGTGVGKSIGLCHLATEYMQLGLNVLYVSFEMSEETVGKRIDANLMDLTLDELDSGLIQKSEFMNRFNKKVAGKKLGKLYVKQFPTSGANVNHIRNLMDELEMKKGFKPDVIMVDYLGIMASSRMKFSDNSYSFIKAISEEVRGLAIEKKIVAWSGAQTNRGSSGSLEIDKADIADSYALLHGCDFVLAISEDEDLVQMGQQLFKQLKSRYGDINTHNKFCMVVEKAKMRWSDLDDTTPYTVVFERKDLEERSDIQDDAVIVRRGDEITSVPVEVTPEVVDEIDTTPMGSSMFKRRMSKTEVDFNDLLAEQTQEDDVPWDN